MDIRKDEIYLNYTIPIVMVRNYNICFWLVCDRLKNIFPFNASVGFIMTTFRVFVSGSGEIIARKAVHKMIYSLVC